jgi:hypothetical protein
MARVLSQERRSGRQESLPLVLLPGDRGARLGALLDATDAADPTFTLDMELQGLYGAEWRTLAGGTYTGSSRVNARTGLATIAPPKLSWAGLPLPEQTRVILTPSRPARLGADLDTLAAR